MKRSFLRCGIIVLCVLAALLLLVGCDNGSECRDHDYGDWVQIKAPSCTEEGEEQRTCKNCDHYELRDVEATGHNYTHFVTPATCLSGGYTIHTCSCGFSYTDTYPDTVDHTWSDSVSEKPATERVEGARVYTCIVCHIQKKETIPCFEHVHRYPVVVTAPTCTEKGYTTHTCSCGDSYVDTYRDAVGHNYVDDVCQNCGKSLIPALELNSDGTSYVVTGMGMCEETEIIIPSTYKGLPVTAIEADAFGNNASITSISIPAGVVDIGAGAFVGCSSLISIDIDPGNKVYHSAGNCIIETESKKLIAGCASSVLPDDGSVIEIGEGAFRDCTGLASIVLPVGVTSISDNAFYGCTGLVSITIPDGVTSIGDGAFSGCHSLASITIPDSVTSIGGWMFYWCKSLVSITIPDGVTHIGEMMFWGCAKLASITIPDSVTDIGGYAFYGCERLVNIEIPAGVTHIGKGAFNLCTSLVSVNIPDNVNIIERYMFAGCSSLASITIPNGVTSIGEGAFSGCSSLESIIFPVGVTNVDEDAFRDCSKLVGIVIPDSVTSIGWGAFCNCTSLSEITIPRSVIALGERAFCGCSSLVSLIVDPDNEIYHSVDDCIIETKSKKLVATCLNSVVPSDGSVTSIGEYAFSGRSDLASIIIPDTVTTICDRAFSACQSLVDITIPNSVTSIGMYAFSGCSSLESITIPDSVTSIGGCAFCGCKSLVSITIPDGVTSIGDGVFDSCESLVSLTISDSVTSVGNSVFYRCKKLEKVSFKGTKEQWQTIYPEKKYSYKEMKFTVCCADGDVESWR